MIQGISSNDSVYGSTDGTATQELDRNAFMSLLVEQMRNQDPLQPTANDQFIAQLAQFSSLEEMENLNDSFLGLAVLQQSNALMSQLTQGSNLIGQEVVFQDPSTGELDTGNVDSVRIQDGVAVLNVDGFDVPLMQVVEITGPATEADSGDITEGDTEGN